jgi:hypothetical protein
VQCAQLTPEVVEDRPPTCLVSAPSWTRGDPELSAATAADLTELLASWSDSVAGSIRDALADLGAEQRVYAAHPVLRESARRRCRRLLAGSTLDGAEHLADAIAAGPTVVVCNHQSYIDSNAIDAILCDHGLEELADRLVSVAGPKVYEGLLRRLISTSLGTLPVPQSATLDHTARRPARDLARRSLEAVRQAHATMHRRSHGRRGAGGPTRCQDGSANDVGRKLAWLSLTDGAVASVRRAFAARGWDTPGRSRT